MTEQLKYTENAHNNKDQLPYSWSIRIARIPTNNEEANDPDINKEVFCMLNDLDMLIVQQNDVMDELLDGSFFEDVLNNKRQNYRDETFGKEVD